MPYFPACLLALLVFVAGFFDDANAAQQVYRQANMLPGYHWTEGLVINLDADEALCKKHYGSRWQAGCAGALGRPGSAAQGIKMAPEAPGHWEWQTANSLVFIPADKNSLKPDTVYKADLSALQKPAFVSLNTLAPSCRSLPLAARLLESRFFIDPSPKGAHRAAMSMQFNYPVPKDNFHFAFITPPDSSFGKAEAVWNADRDLLNISWPVRHLPPHAGQASLRLDKIAQIAETDKGPRFHPAGQSGVIFSQNIPAASEIFKIANMKLAEESDAALNKRYVLDIETTLQAKAEDVAKNLEILELPEFASKESIKPYDWAQAPVLSADALARSRKLVSSPLQNASREGTHFRFDLPVKSGRYALVRIDSQLQALSGQKLARPWQGVATARPLQGAVGFLQPGNILTGNGALEIFGAGVDVIDWDVQLVREPFWAILAQASGNVFAEPLEKSDLNMDSLSQRASGKINLPKGPQGQASYAALEIGKEMAKLSNSPSGMALVTLTGLVDGKIKATARKLVLATDLGLLLKRGKNGDLHCFAHNIADREPASGAEINILGANGQIVAKAKADGQGHAAIASLDGLARESRPVVAVARQGDNIAWLPLADRSRVLDFSSFDVGGSHVEAGAILAFVFSQRGMYRPGDTLYFGCVPRKGDFSLLPEKLPLYAELLDPRGVKVWEQIFTPGKNGIAQLQWQSGESSLSGRYALNVKNGKGGELLGSTNVRIESFQPDTMKMKVESPIMRGWLVTDAKKPVEADVFLQNLYGSPAVGHKVKGSARMLPASFRFAGFGDWTFTDPAPFLGNGSSRQLPEAETDKTGKASIALPPDLFGSSSANIVVLAEGFDKSGGRGAAAHATFLASPMRQILGYKFAGALTNPDFVGKNDKAALEFMSINHNLEKTAWPDILWFVLKRDYVTNLISDGQGGYRYDEVPQELIKRKWSESLPLEGLTMDLDTAEPGEYLLVAQDAAGHTLARIPYNVVGDKLMDANNKLAGSKMRMRLDKADYASGDEINIALSLPYDAYGILSIEREGAPVWQWFSAHAGDNVAKLRIPENFEGRGHVVATFMRSTDSDEIYMSPLAHAAAPFNANIAARDMGIKLAAPKLAKPGDNLEVAISADKPGEAALFLVDEGILQLTSFQTPNPLATLLADRALDVSTLQTADLLMPEQGKLVQRIKAFGGGAEGMPFGAKFQNPFKRRNEPPATVWLGLVKVGNEPVKVNMPVPAWYNGKARIMAVGAGEAAAGSASVDVVARDNLVITPMLPLAVAPGDVFEGSLILANTANEPMELETIMNSGDAFTVIKPLQAKIALAAGEEAAFPITLKAKDLPGAQSIDFVCATPDKHYKRNVSLSLRPAGPMRTTVQAGMAKDGADLPKSRPVYAVNAESAAMASPLPVPLAASLGAYLDTYPYGCTEQLISRAFANVLLAKWPLANVDAKKRREIINAANGAIASRFQEGMGVSLWDRGQPDLLLTAYAADYLLALREAGMGGGEDLLARLCDALRWNCALNEPTVAAARASAYAIWVLARAGNVVTQLLEELSTAIVEKGIKDFHKDIGYALMVGAMKEMYMPAKLEMAELVFNPGGWFDNFAQYSLASAIIARYFPDQLTQAEMQNYFDSVVMMLNSNTFSTFAASQGARALLSLGNANSANLKEARLQCLDKKAQEKVSLDAGGLFLTATAPVCGQYKLDWAHKDKPLFWQVSTTGYDKNMGQKKTAHGIDITSALLDSAGQPVKTVKQGDEVEVEITIRADQPAIRDCVITSLLPGGLEMVIPRGGENLPEGVKFLDRQEDRILIFADIANRPMRIAYKARAVTPGIYHLPGAAAEAMYDRAIYGAAASGNLEIGK